MQERGDATQPGGASAEGPAELQKLCTYFLIALRACEDRRKLKKLVKLGSKTVLPLSLFSGTFVIEFIVSVRFSLADLLMGWGPRGPSAKVGLRPQLIYWDRFLLKNQCGDRN